jgi:hypothetical protein
LTVTLLTGIQSAATDPWHSTADLLRKCQILAFRLYHDPFRQWVGHQLNGYPDDAVLPPYRGPFQVDLKADTQGAFGAGVRNVGVPDWSIPEEVRDKAKEMSFYQGVGALESLIDEARRADQRVVAYEFSTDFAVLTQVVQNQQTVRLWKQVPVTLVAGILDQIRSKALEFVLEIESANPDAGSTTTSEPPVPLARADIIFNTVILGGQNAIGPGATVNVTPGDIGSLLAYLEAQGVEFEDRTELERAVRADDGEFGPRVKAWLGTMAAKTASVGGAVAEKAAIGVITAAVLRFFNIA